MSTTNTLTFVSSQSIAQFKSSKMIDTINVKKNSATDKLFISFVGGTGAVSRSYDTTKPKMISLVRDSEGVEFYMLHNEGTGAETLETL
jgi:hypothetical protein